MVKVRILSPERKTKLTDPSDVTDRYHFDFKQMKSNKNGPLLENTVFIPFVGREGLDESVHMLAQRIHLTNF